MCQQTVSLTARVLEAGGIATVVVGSGRDVVEECGVARFLFTDLPLGKPLGRPGDVGTQRAVLDQALDLAERAWTPRTTVQSPVVWDRDDTNGWRHSFMLVNDLNRALLAAEGDRRRRQQDTDKGNRSVRK